MSADWQARRLKLKSHWPGWLALLLASWAYGAAVLLRHLLYDLGALRRKRLSAKVISIGNLTVGGTGKTPATLYAASLLRSRQHKVAILSRGYGRKSKSKEVSVLLEDNAPSWEECGDEPWMMRHVLEGQGIPILVCPDRAVAGARALEFYHSHALILDDGFQHRRLWRDLDIVLINATNPFGGGRLLPLGDLREPKWAIRRAHLVLLTHVNFVPASNLHALREEIKAIHPSISIVESVHKSDFLLELRTGVKKPLGALKSRKVVVFSGIASPALFEAEVEELGAKVAQRWRYPDHHPYGFQEIQAIENLRRGLAGRGEELCPVVTTLKDFPRLPAGWADVLSGEVYAIAVKIEILKGHTLWQEALCRGL